MRHGERGFTVLLGIIAMVLAAMAAAMVLELVHHDVGELRLEERSATLIALTDAALAETLARLAADPAAPGLAPRSLGQGRISSTVERRGDGVRVRARAESAGWQALLEAEVALAAGPPRVTSWRRSHGPARRRVA